jgi:hypothetical protein
MGWEFCRFPFVFAGARLFISCQKIIGRWKMPLTRHDWNVVVVGRWNRAILTPQGVATRLFNIAPDDPVPLLVEFPLDALGPFRLTHNELVVMVTDQQLIVESQARDLPGLHRAMEVAIRALRQLPETPVTAAGFNIRYRVETHAAIPPCLADAFQHIWEHRFADAGHPIIETGLNWISRWGESKIGVNMVRGEQDLRINLNFERSGVHNDLVDWLSRPIVETEIQLQVMLSDILHVRPEDIS